MSLHKISKINLLKIRKDIDIIWFDGKKILKTITSTPEFIFGLIIILAKKFLNCQKLIENNILVLGRQCYLMKKCSQCQL